MNNENLNATLRCVTRPSAAQEEKIRLNRYIGDMLIYSTLMMSI